MGEGDVEAYLDSICEMLRDVASGGIVHRDWVEASLRNEANVKFGAFDEEGKLIGYAEGVPFLCATAKALDINSVVTRAEFRGNGVARSLVEKLIAYARDAGYADVRLLCREHNVDFYKKLGFEVREQLALRRLL